MSLEKEGLKPLVWEIKDGEEDHPGDKSWEISATRGDKSARIVVYEKFRADSQGLYVSDLLNASPHANKEQRLTRSDFASMWRTVIACMDDAGKKKIYIEPGANSIQKMIESLGGELHSIEEDGPYFGPRYIISREQLELFCKRLERKS